MRSSLLLLSLLLAVATVNVRADQVVLKNGDKLTGTIVKADGKELVIKTEFAGEVTIQYPAVQEIKSEQQLHIEAKDGQKAVGAVSTADGKVEVATKSGPVEVPRENITIIRNDAEQMAYEKAMHPGLLEGWDGGVNLGFGLTRGNSATKNLGVAFKAVRTGHRDKLSIYQNTVYATNDAPDATPSQTADLKQGGVRYDRDLTKKLFAFGITDFMSDGLQGLNIRALFGGGLGYHAIKSETTTLDLLGGANYTHENYTEGPPGATTSLIRNFASLQIGDEFMHKIRKSTVITQSFYFFPDMSNTGEYRTNFNIGTVTKLNKWLGWQNAFGDIYVTNPPAGKEKNDLFFTTGLNIAFTH